MKFRDKLSQAIQSQDSLLCVGLDPYPELLPIKDVLRFNQAIIEATQDLVCAYKPNLAFYEALGLPGLRALEKTRRYIPSSIPFIGDAKRGDIGSTAQAYARALFDVFGFDAITVNPYLGYDSIAPYLKYEDKAIFLLCKTSNPGAADFQPFVYELIARKAREWNREGNVGLVVGATYPQDLKRVRELCPDLVLLIPGVGTQGGEVEAAVSHGIDRQGEGAIISVTRQIIYASHGRDYAQKARQAALALRREINNYRRPNLTLLSGQA
ncbi:MAG: orotidine-5'-phosphate decarboxylase [Chloroflexota bacterium]